MSTPWELGQRSYIQKVKRKKHINNVQTSLSLYLMSVIHKITSAWCIPLFRGLSQHSNYLNDLFASVIYSYRLKLQLQAIIL